MPFYNESDVKKIRADITEIRKGRDELMKAISILNQKEKELLRDLRMAENEVKRVKKMNLKVINLDPGLRKDLI